MDGTNPAGASSNTFFTLVAFISRSIATATSSSVTAVLREEVAPGELVLVKASRAAGLWKMAEALLDQVPVDQDHAGGRGHLDRDDMMEGRQ